MVKIETDKTNHLVARAREDGQLLGSLYWYPLEGKWRPNADICALFELPRGSRWATLPGAQVTINRRRKDYLW